MEVDGFVDRVLSDGHEIKAALADMAKAHAEFISSEIRRYHKALLN